MAGLTSVGHGRWNSARLERPAGQRLARKTVPGPPSPSAEVDPAWSPRPGGDPRFPGPGQALAEFQGKTQALHRPDRQAGRQTVTDFAELWWKQRQGHRPSTRIRDRQALDRDVLPFFGAAQLGRLDRADVQEWVDQLAERMAPATVRRTFTVMDQLLRSAVDRGVIGITPATGVRLPRLVRHEGRFLTPAELERLADSIDPRYRAMVLVMAWATLRIGEAAGLRRVDQELEVGTIRIANNAVQVRGRVLEGPPKTKAGRRSMTLPDSIVSELRDHLVRQPGMTYVFGPSGERPLYASDFRRLSWRPAVRAADLEPLRPHDLKHTGVISPAHMPLRDMSYVA